jgi:hypothetical protein
VGQEVIRAAIILAALFGGPAFAAQQCGPRDQVLAGLEARWSETRQMAGMSSAGSVVEIFANPASGSWTLLATSSDGTTCLAASG